MLTPGTSTLQFAADNGHVQTIGELSIVCDFKERLVRVVPDLLSTDV